MTTPIILGFLAVLLLFPAFGLVVGLGPGRFWWLVERGAWCALWLFGAGLDLGERIARRWRK